MSGVLPDPNERPTITVPEAGRLFGLSRSSAYAAARAGELPVLQFGSRLVCPTRKVLALLGADTHPTTDEPAED